MTPKTVATLIAAVPTTIFLIGSVLLLDFNAELVAFFGALPLSNSLGLLAYLVYIGSMVAFMPACMEAWNMHKPATDAHLKAAQRVRETWVSECDPAPMAAKTLRALDYAIALAIANGGDVIQKGRR